MDGPKGEPVSFIINFNLIKFKMRVEILILFNFQGRAGDKGQKGEGGSPGFDVFSAVKVCFWNMNDILYFSFLFFFYCEIPVN